MAGSEIHPAASNVIPVRPSDLREIQTTALTSYQEVGRVSVGYVCDAFNKIAKMYGTICQPRPKEPEARPSS